MTSEADPTARTLSLEKTGLRRESSDDRDDAKECEVTTSLTPLLFGVGLFAVAFALRFFAARAFAGEPVWDGHYYDFGARRIAEGHGYSDDRVVSGITEWHPWCHYPVGYSAYLAAFYRVLGAHGWVAHLANGLTGALVAVVVYLLAREGLVNHKARAPGDRAGLSERRARFAGALTALHPGLILYGALVMGELLSALTVMTAFWVAVRGTRLALTSSACEDDVPMLTKMRGIVAGALVLGVGALVRPQALLCAPFLALALPLARSSSRWSAWIPRLAAAAIACVLALVPVLPWTARNCRVMDGCALVSTNAGWNLAIGSFPRATGRFETLRSSDGCREVTGQVQQDRCWFAYGLENIRQSPMRWLGLIPAKLSNTFDHESFAVEYLREARPADWPEPRRVAWRSMLSTTHRILVIVAALAFVALVVPRRRLRESRVASITQGALLLVVLVSGYLGIAADTPTLWPIVVATCVLAWLPLPGRPTPTPVLALPVVLVATTAITHAVFFGDDRYHIVVTPALCLLAAAAFRAPNRSGSKGPSDSRPTVGGTSDTRGADTGGVRAAGTSSS